MVTMMAIDEDDFFDCGDDISQEERDFMDFQWRKFLRKDNRISKIHQLFKDEFVWHKEDGGLCYDHLYRVERKDKQ